MSQWLGNPRVGYILCGVVSIAPVISVILAAFAATETSIRVMSAGLLLVIVGSIATFLACARSLVSVIDSSLERKSQEQAKKRLAGPGGDNGRVGRDPNLLTSRKKIMKVVAVGATMSSIVFLTLSLATFTPWGTAAPLVLFGIPLGKTVVPSVLSLMSQPVLSVEILPDLQ